MDANTSSNSMFLKTPVSGAVARLKPADMGRFKAGLQMKASPTATKAALLPTPASAAQSVVPAGNAASSSTLVNAQLYTQAAAGQKPAPAETEADKVKTQFKDFAKASPQDRMQQQILAEQGLTKEQVNNMAPAQRAAMEQQMKVKISQVLAQK